MLKWNFESGKTIIRNYGARVRQCEELEEYAMCEQIRGILKDKQIHQVALEAALNKTVLTEAQNAQSDSAIAPWRRHESNFM